MSTTYSSTTKDSSKDKDSTDTYVRSSTETSDTSKNTAGKNKTTTDTDKSHDNDTSLYGKTGTNISSNTQYGVQSRGQQYGQGGQDSEHASRQQSEIQQKLKEVGNLLQKAGHLLQDLQGSSGDFQVSSQWSRGQGGNYSGPYGGFESQHPSPYGQHSSSYGPSSQWNHPSSSQYGQGPSQGPSYRFEGDRAPQGGRFNEDRELYGPTRGFSGRPEERFESRLERGNTDRFGGFGGPNRPDLAYGEQYGTEGRRSDNYEFSRRGNNSRW